MRLIDDSMLEAIRTFAGQLNDAMDSLNESLDDLEDALADLRLGVAASIELKPGVKLWFKKQSKEWGLLLEHEINPDHFQSVRNANREEKLLVAHAAPMLLQAMVEEAKTQLSNVRQAQRNVDKFLEAFRKLESCKPSNQEPEPSGR